MKTIYFAPVVFILFPLLFAHGQERIDVVYLKNGDILKGTIIENAPNNYVKIELSEGLVFTVKYTEIVRFTKEKAVNTTKDQQQYRSNSQMVMYYEKERKNPGAAIILSLVMTSTGHAYVGNWGRGLLFTAARVGSAAFALTAGIQTKSIPSSTLTTTEITPYYYIGFGSSLIFAIWEAIDVSAEAEQYNDDLFQKVFGEKPLSMNIIQTANGNQFQIAYSF